MPRTPHPALARWVLLGLAALGGCSRQDFRNRADKDVEGVISQKNLFPDWKVENWHVYPDPRARFGETNTTTPDFPPYPPDDYAAWVTAPNPQHPGRGGAGRYEGKVYLQMIAGWDAQNRAEDEMADGADPNRDVSASPSGGTAATFDPQKPGNYAPSDPANPQAGQEFAAVAGGAASYLRVFATDEQPFRIRVEQAMELALLNAREFQDRREDLYLAALPVTLQRFSFAAQAVAAEQVIRQSIGRDVPGGGGEFWRINTNPTITRNFATGGQLLVKLANQIVVDLTGGKPETSLSNLSLTFIQPLLRGGGYAVTLEALTQAERTLLYAIRSYERFRRIFYGAIVGAGNYTNNPYGLQGLSANLGRGIGANLTANPVGYLPTIQRAAIASNDRRNVASLEQFLKLFQNLREGGVVSELQVNTVEQQLINGRTTLLTDTRTYLDNIDGIKLQLGVPTTLPLELDDTPLRPVRRQLQRFDQLYTRLRELEQAASRFDPVEPPGRLRERWQELLTNSSLARGTQFAKDYPSIAQRLRGMADDAITKEISTLQARRQKLLDERADRELKNLADTPAQVAELEAVEAAIDRLFFERALRRYEARPWLRAPADRQVAEQAVSFQAAFQAGFLVAVQLRNEVLAKIRADWPRLPPILVDGCDLIQMPLDAAYTKVAQTALLNRLDLMNARAQVVDAWRQLTVQANSLQGVFTVQYDLTTRSPQNEANGLGFAGTRTTHTVTLNIEPPFVRRAERNNYRSAIISYQRSRRNLMAFEDNILVDSRVDLRALRQLAEQYVLQQRAVELGYATVDNARATLLAPPDPAVRDTAGSVAALTQQLLQAQNNLLQAQNTLYTTWITYASTRIDFFLDLELLHLDARGIWIDDPAPPPDRRPDGPDGRPPPPPGPVAGNERPAGQKPDPR